MDALHLAQLNIARLRAPLEDPLLASFVAQLDSINALAERSDGFVWRLDAPAGDPGVAGIFDDPALIVNMSVWQDMESLKRYVYQSDHVALIKQRSDWFTPMTSPHLVLWWVPAGVEPGVNDAKARLELLENRGPGPSAFTFASPFAAPFSTTAPGSAETGFEFSAAAVDDHEAVLRLLRDSDLPVADLDDEGWALLRHWFLLLRSAAGELAGCVALEPTRDGALIRSLCVDAHYRRQGHARTLVHRVEALARARQIEALYLLTETAGELFASLGYGDLERSRAPAAIRRTAQFADLCPDTSRCMRRTL